MIPKTISASSLNTADSCLARYKAENIEFTPTGSDKTAANIGTACHGALENYVRKVYIDKTHEPTLQLVVDEYDISFKETFDTVETKGPEYKDGLALVSSWHERTDFTGVQVISAETKTRFPMPTSIGPIPLTYICDRIDLLEVDGRRILRIVDYKSIRAFLSHEEVREKLQARIYDLMARIQFKNDNIDEYQVVFDLLRHDTAVGVVFSREEAEETYSAIIARAERIIATDGDNPPETLNAECPYCVRKSHCATLRRNIEGGGIGDLDSIEEAASLRYQLDSQKRGIESFLDEVDTFILKFAEFNEINSFNAGNDMRVVVSSRKTRDVNNSAAAAVLGPDLMKRFGKLGVAEVDTIVKSKILDDDKLAELSKAVGFKFSKPSVKVTKKST